jgi:hypothetical protein
LPRHAGAIAQFLFTHPKASRNDLLNFMATTWEIRVSKVALWKFLQKYGLDRDSLAKAPPPATDEETAVTAIESLEQPATGAQVPSVPDDFFCPHPVRRRLPALAPSALLARHRPRLLCR